MNPLDLHNLAAGAEHRNGARNLAARRLRHLAAAAGLVVHVYGDGTVQLETAGPPSVFLAVSSDVWTAANLLER